MAFLQEASELDTVERACFQFQEREEPFNITRLLQKGWFGEVSDADHRKCSADASFQGKYGRDISLDWKLNKKAWMNWGICYGWLKRLNAYVGLKPERKMLLIIENCTAHGKAESMITLQNVRLCFPQPN